MPKLETLLSKIHACRRCEAHLPLGPRPIVRVSTSATLLLVGQAPGRRVHETGIPWNDPSGDRLRDWLGMSPAEFYDQQHLAIVPTGLCYPGTGTRGDAPPRAECAPLWHPQIRPLMPRVVLTLLIGQYAQAYYLGTRRKKTLRETVQAYREYLPDFLPLPHPSPRNQLWFKKNPWFAVEVLPLLKLRVRQALG